jgi:diguanylate cyclase (GGDEF)-like protein
VLYIIPIVVIASELGILAGLVTAVLASAAVFLYAEISGTGYSALDYAIRMVAFILVSAIVGRHADQTYAALDKVAVLARTDALTGVANRRAWDEELEKAIARAHREKHRLAVVMLDIDSFKQYNDRYGHPIADALLHNLAQAWKSTLRQTDFIARYAGDEFALFLPDCPPRYAEAVLQRMREVTRRDCRWSAGIAYLTGAETAARLTERADRALYDAKESGRDQVITARSKMTSYK